MKHPVIAEVAIVPLGTGSTSLSRYVADVEKVLSQIEVSEIPVKEWEKALHSQ